MEKLKKVFLLSCQNVRHYFGKGIGTKNALGISIGLHLMLVLALGAMHFGEFTLPSNSHDEAIALELITSQDLNPATFEELLLRSDFTGSSQSHQSSVDNIAKSVGLLENTSKVLVAEKATVSKEAVMMASLASLIEMKASFKLALQEIVADSIGAFTPIQGSAPSTKIFSQGSIYGSGFGRRSGVVISAGGGRGGNCPPRGGGDILKK